MATKPNNGLQLNIFFPTHSGAIRYQRRLDSNRTDANFSRVSGCLFYGYSKFLHYDKAKQNTDLKLWVVRNSARQWQKGNKSNDLSTAESIGTVESVEKNFKLRMYVQIRNQHQTEILNPLNAKAMQTAKIPLLQQTLHGDIELLQMRVDYHQAQVNSWNEFFQNTKHASIVFEGTNGVKIIDVPNVNAGTVQEITEAFHQFVQQCHAYHLNQLTTLDAKLKNLQLLANVQGVHNDDGNNLPLDDAG